MSKYGTYQKTSTLSSIRLLLQYHGDKRKLTSTSSPSSSSAMTSTIKLFVWGGIAFLLTVSTNSFMRKGKRSWACTDRVSQCKKIQYPLNTASIAFHSRADLLGRSETAPQHRNTLWNHAEFEFMLILEESDDLVQGRVSLQLEPIPQCPLSFAILLIATATK